jgi:hypothetical protein
VIGSWRFAAVAGFFVTALVVSNIIAVKLAEVGGRVFDAGNVPLRISSETSSRRCTASARRAA